MLEGLLTATGIGAGISIAVVVIHIARNCSNSICCGGATANTSRVQRSRRDLLVERIKRVYKWTLAWWFTMSVGLAVWYELYKASALLMAQL